MKEALAGYGISIDDNHISKSAKLVHGISQRGYDVSKGINEFSDLESADWILATIYPDFQLIGAPILGR